MMNVNKRIKLFGLILGVVLFVILMVGITYAWFTWKSSDISISGSTECFIINNNKGSNISQTIDDVGVILFDENNIINDNKVTVREGMALTNVTASIDSECNMPANLTITLSINKLNDAYTDLGYSTGAFKYVIASYDPSVYTDITTTALNTQSFDIIQTGSISSTESIQLVNEALSATSKGYLIIFYVDGDLAMNDAQGSTFSGVIDAVVMQTE